MIWRRSQVLAWHRPGAGRQEAVSLASVEENLLIGAYSKRPGPWTLARIYQLFPVLEKLRKRPGTALSGGQQQMVAIGRG